MTAIAPWYFVLVLAKGVVVMPMADEKACRDAVSQLNYWYAGHCLASGFKE